MEQAEWKAVVEGLLFVAGDEGISKKQLLQVTGLADKALEEVLRLLKEDYRQTERGITLMESKDNFHLTTKAEHALYYKKLIDTPSLSRLSQAALETLAIIAYQQPITKTEIEEIRGVKSDRPVQTLISRSLVTEAGRKESIGRPILYGTSTDFLVFFGLSSLDDLPPLPEKLAETDEEEADLFFASIPEDINDK